MLEAKRICMVRLGGLGDVINTLPALDALRAARPEAHIAWLVESVWQDVLPEPPRLDEAIPLPKREWLGKLRRADHLASLPGDLGAFVRELRARECDLAVDFHGNLRSGIATLATGAPVRAGYAPGFCKEFSYLFTNRHYPAGGGRMHRIDRALALAKAVGADPQTDTPVVDVRAADREFARQAFEDTGLNTRPAVAIHPGTSRFGAYKRWPADRFGEVIRRLDEHGFGSLVTWGPGEHKLAVEAAAGTRAVVAPKTGRIGRLAGLLSLCDAFVGADTGPGLLAAAVDTPPVSLFGPKDPAIYAPRHPRARVVEVPLDCRPCRKRSCDDPRCMLHITVRHVAEAVLALLNEMEGN
jgi:ADP-heptose:LPS heptosyltransferase